MKALVLDGVPRLDHSRPDPHPKAGEALIKVHLAGICGTDLELARGYLGFRGVPGHEFVGQVVSGSDRWVGRRVVGEINCACRSCDMCNTGLANHCRRRTVLGIAGRDGAFAQFLTLPESNLHEVPETVPDADAVFVEPLAAALQVLRQCPVETRTRVAVVGSGRLGLLLAQVLKLTGCKLEIIGRNPHTLQFCDRLGIQSRRLDELVPRAEHDVVVDCTGSAEALPLALQLVRPRGTLVLKSTHAAACAVNLTSVVVDEVTLVGSRCGPFADAIAALARRQIDVAPLISRTCKLAQAVEALQAAENPANIKVLLEMN